MLLTCILPLFFSQLLGIGATTTGDDYDRHYFSMLSPCSFSECFVFSICLAIMMLILRTGLNAHVSVFSDSALAARPYGGIAKSGSIFKLLLSRK